MRGYKAKVLRRIAKSMHPEDSWFMGYIKPTGDSHTKIVRDGDLRVYPMKVTNPMVHRSTARRMYKAMKRDMR